MKINSIITVVLTVGLAFGSTSIGVLKPYELDDEAAYVKCLNNYHLGVVESAIFCVVKMQNSHKDIAYNDIVRTLNRLSRSGRTASIRYKANIANIYLKDQAQMAKLDLSNYDDGTEFWAMLVANLDSKPGEWN